MWEILALKLWLSQPGGTFACCYGKYGKCKVAGSKTTTGTCLYVHGHACGILASKHQKLPCFPSLRTIYEKRKCHMPFHDSKISSYFHQGSIPGNVWCLFLDIQYEAISFLTPSHWTIKQNSLDSYKFKVLL